MPDSRIHITYLIGQLGMGGYEKQMTLLVESIDRSKFKTSIIVWGSEKGYYLKRLTSIGIEVTSIRRLNFTNKLFFIRNSLKRNKSKFIHNYSFFLNFITWLSSLFTPAKPIGAVRSNVKYESESMPMILKLLNIWFPRVIIFNSYSAKSYLESAIFLPSKQESIVIQNGIDVSLYPKVEYKKNKIIRLLSIGSLKKIKRQNWLIKIGERLEQSNIDFQIDILGEGPLFDQLEKQISNSDLDKKINLHGNIDSPIKYFLQSDIFLHTSSVEGFPNAVLEAMVIGLPIIACDAGDISLMIDNDKEGFVTPINDFNIFYQKLIHLIDNPKIRREVGLAAMSKARKKYTHNQLINNVCNLYHNQKRF